MKSMKDLKYKKLRIKPLLFPLPFMIFMSFMVNISYSSLSNPAFFFLSSPLTSHLSSLLSLLPSDSCPLISDF